MRVRGISTEEISLSYTFNEDDCVERLRLSFSFIRGCLLKRYSAHPCCISAVISD